MSKYYINIRNRGNFPAKPAEWNDIYLPMANLATGATAPTVAVSNNIRFYTFAGGTSGTSDELHGSFEMTHGYKEGTNIDLHVHWFATTGTTGGVVFGVDYSVYKVGEAPVNVTGVTVLARTITGDETGLHRISDVAQISGTGLQIGDVIMFRIYRPRIATNTYAGDTAMISLGVHCLFDTLGSREETAK